MRIIIRFQMMLPQLGKEGIEFDMVELGSKKVMLDEIINYVQSLQQQVEGKNILTMQDT